MRIATSLLLTLFLSAPFSDALSAQVIQGRVLAAVGGAPIADASVTLLDERGRVQRGTLTEPDGTFIIQAPKENTYTLRVGAMGFATWDSPKFKAEEDEPVEYSVRLSSEGGSTLEGFHARMQAGEGTFVTEDVIGAGGSKFTDVLKFVEGVTVVPLPMDTTLFAANQSARLGAENAGQSQDFTVRVQGGGLGPSQAGVQKTRERNECVPVLWVDGRWWGPIDEASDRGPDTVLEPKDLYGIEIYHPSVLPPEFNTGADSRCGVIVVWRK